MVVVFIALYQGVAGHSHFRETELYEILFPVSDNTRFFRMRQ